MTWVLTMLLDFVRENVKQFDLFLRFITKIKKTKKPDVDAKQKNF